MMSQKNECFKAVRIERMMTILELAGKSGVSSSYISKLDSGWVIPSQKIAVKISKVLKCEVSDIFPNLQSFNGGES